MSKPKNYEKMIENKPLFRARKMSLSLVGADTIFPKPAGVNLDCLILLSKANSKKVEKAIKKDFLYVNFVKTVCDDIMAKNGGKFPDYDKRSIFKLVKIIDYENSTDVWIHCRKSFIKMVKYIANPKKDFWNELKRPNKMLVDDLTRFSKEAVTRKNKGSIKIVDAEFGSLASKICKYFAQYIFKKDFYYINDKFIRRVLPYYYWFYLGEKISTTNITYEKLYDYLEDIRKEVSKTSKLTRNEIDHIMWYCYKSSSGLYRL